MKPLPGSPVIDAVACGSVIGDQRGTNRPQGSACDIGAVETHRLTVGGTVSGLVTGNSVVLQNSGGDDHEVTANGAFSFPTALLDESPYSVSVLTQPSGPNQVCSVTNDSGTLSGADVTDVQITCVTSTYTVGGSVTGLAAGNSVVLQNNGGDDLALAVDGPFTFPTALLDGSSYEVTVLTQPTSPSQTCSVSNGSDTLGGADVTSVQVTCATNTYAVGGTVSGLATGNSVVLQNNGGDDHEVTANGAFSFPTALLDESPYSVSVLTQPSGPNQVCSVTNDSGTLSGADVTDVQITCVTSTYTVGGSVTGLAAGNSVVLQNNGGDDLALAVDGPFTFPTALLDGSSYEVTVLTQPTSPSQTCSVSNGSDTLGGTDVTSVQLMCVTTAADLVLTKSGTTGEVMRGDAVSYSIIVSNPHGPADALANILDLLPSELNISTVSWMCTSNGGATCTSTDGQGDINIVESIPVGSSVLLTIDATVRVDAARGIMRNEAVVELISGTDDDTSNNIDEHDIEVECSVFCDGFEQF